MTKHTEKNINLTFIRGGRATVGVKNRENEFWNTLNKNSEENKFYLPICGRGELFIDGTHYPLEKGRWYLIGAGEKRSYYTANTSLEKWVVHFYGQTDGKNLKEELDLPDFVELDDEEFKQALCLMQKVDIHNMQSPANIFELFENKSKVFDILSYYIELSEKKNLHFIKNRDSDSKIRTMLFDYINSVGTSNINTKAISESIGLNERYFLKYFKKLLFITPNQLSLKKRLTLAKTFLIYENDNIDSVAKKCGFESTSYFCEWFKKHVGISPLQLRKDYIFKSNNH